MCCHGGLSTGSGTPHSAEGSPREDVLDPPLPRNLISLERGRQTSKVLGRIKLDSISWGASNSDAKSGIPRFSYGYYCHQLFPASCLLPTSPPANPTGLGAHSVTLSGVQPRSCKPSLWICLWKASCQAAHNEGLSSLICKMGIIPVSRGALKRLKATTEVQSQPLAGPQVTVIQPFFNRMSVPLCQERSWGLAFK